MNNVKANLSHMVMGVVAIAAVTILCVTGHISGGEALGVIAAATGFTMGVGGSSVSGTGVPGITPATSVSPGETLTEATTHTVTSVPATPPEA